MLERQESGKGVQAVPLDAALVTAEIRKEIASYGITPSTAEPKATAAIMAMTRPMPTREQLEEAAGNAWLDPNPSFHAVMDAVWNLLGGVTQDDNVLCAVPTCKSPAICTHRQPR